MIVKLSQTELLEVMDPVFFIWAKLVSCAWDYLVIQVCNCF